MYRNEAMKKCPYSGDKFYPKRTNQKFLNDECRIAYHNDKSNELRTMRAKVDRILHKNHKIIVELMGDTVRKSFSLQFLEGKGYSTGVLTGFKKLNDKWYHTLYNFIVIQSKNDTVTVIKIDDE